MADRSIDPTQLALRTLDEHWPEQTIPVNPAIIGHRLGLLVQTADLPDDVSGALVRLDGDTYSVMVSATDSFNRRRFTCAHEIGHYLDRKAHGEQPEEMVDYRDGTSSLGNEPREVFANQFAAELLMPSWAVREYFSKIWRVADLARFFNVSPSAMEYRLKNLGLVKA